MKEWKYLRLMWTWDLWWIGIGVSFPSSRQKSWVLIIHIGPAFACLHTHDPKSYDLD